MKKISIESAQSFMDNKKFKKSNTRVQVENGITSLHLYESCIAVKDSSGNVFISNRGYTTVTTKERLNAILSHFNNGIYQRKGVWYFNDGTVFADNVMHQIK